MRKLHFLFILSVFIFGACAKQPPRPGAFYQTGTELSGKPGDILRQEAFEGAPSQASAFRVLYVSTGLNEEPIAVSGTIIVPNTPAPDGGRKVVAWAHPTTGVDDRCAPSLRKQMFQTIPGLEKLLQLNYVVAVTDYPGLGTPGPHPYLVGLSEGRAVLDSVRAATRLPSAKASHDFIVWGHSQGGQAALFTGELAKNYAPEIFLHGIVAVAPASELLTLMQDDLKSATGKILTSYSIWSWSRVFNASTEGLVATDAIPVIDKVSSGCIETDLQAMVTLLHEGPLQHSFLIGDPATVEPWKSLFDHNTPGKSPPGGPVFMIQGTADAVVRPEITKSFVQDLCNRGESVKFLELPKVGHSKAAKESADVAVDWIQNRFSNGDPQSDCSNLKQ
jgi:pimeloyl-ACP methyl ester carboxylesterase